MNPEYISKALFFPYTHTPEPLPIQHVQSSTNHLCLLLLYPPQPPVKTPCSPPKLLSFTTDNSAKVSWSTGYLSTWSWACRDKWDLREQKERKTSKHISYSLTTEAKLERCTRYRGSVEVKTIIWIGVGGRLGQQCQGRSHKELLVCHS